MAPQVEDFPHEAPRSRTGAILAAALAVAAAAGLGWWVSLPDRGGAGPAPALQPAAAAVRPAGPVRYAAEAPDRGQVRAAYDQVRELYGEGGPPALVQASEDCARKLPADPTRLDYCLAFDIYAADILPPDEPQGGAGAWFHDADARATALAGAALPAYVSAEGRVGEVRALTLTVLPKAAHRRIKLRHAAVRAAKPRPRLEKAALVRAAPHAARRATRRHKPGHALAFGVEARPPAPKPAASPSPAPAAAGSEDPPL